MTRTLLAALALLVSLSGAPVHAQGAQSLDVEAWLQRPGVRLLAVEFYATWCKPCMKAVPKWKKLHERYADQGLRLIVVATRDPRGQCKNPGWNPDDIVCDTDGRIADALGVGDSLPSAFLWSWRGDLIVRKGHVAEVAKAVKRELLSLPRLIIEPPKGAQKKALKGVVPFVQTELVRTDKVSVVAGAKAQKALARARKRTHNARYTDRTRCKPGEALAANSVLRLDITKVNRQKHLSLQLYNLENGCLSASALSRWNPRRPHISVAEAVSELVGALRVPFESPADQRAPRRARKSKPRGVAVRQVAEDADEWVPEDDAVIAVEFVSKPAGARVTLDGKVVCKKAPCTREVTPGRHRVAMTLARHTARERAVTLEEGQDVSWRLQATFGTLTVRSEPSGVEVTIDGKARGKTPLDGLELAEGEHTVVVKDKCYRKATRVVTLPRGKSHVLDVPVKARPAGLKVSAEDGRGNALKAEVYVDGEKLGRTPKTFSVAVCAREVEVRHKKLGTWKKELSLREKKTTKVVAKLASGGGGGPAPERLAARPSPSNEASSVQTSSAPSAFAGYSLLGFCNRTEAAHSWGFGFLYGCYDGHAVGMLFAPLLYGGGDGDGYGLVLGAGATVVENLVGVQMAPVNYVNGDAAFMQLGGLNDVGGRFDGVQFGIVNLVAETVVGMQAGFINKTSELRGIQYGVFNVVEFYAYGLQVGGINFVVAGDMSGVQVGFLNFVMDKLTGVQLGAVNVAEVTSGLQVGIANWTTSGHIGVQIGVLNMVDHSLYGAQLGGFNFLYAGEFRGAQMGGVMYNNADRGIPFSIALNVGL